MFENLLIRKCQVPFPMEKDNRFPLTNQVGKIDILVPQLYSEGQAGPSTFKLANLNPQLLFLVQTCPCGDVALPTNMRLM